MRIGPIIQKYMTKEFHFIFGYYRSNKRSPFVEEPFLREFDAKVEFHHPINFEDI